MRGSGTQNGAAVPGGTRAPRGQQLELGLWALGAPPRKVAPGGAGRYNRRPMTTYRCPDCGHYIAEDAERCPQCSAGGHPGRRGARRATLQTYLVLAAGAAWLLYTVLTK